MIRMKKNGFNRIEQDLIRIFNKKSEKRSNLLKSRQRTSFSQYLFFFIF